MNWPAGSALGRSSHLKSALLSLLVAISLMIPPGQAWAGILRQPDIKPMLAEATWTLISPVGWAGAPAIAGITIADEDGLQPATAEYQFSTDAGGSWSDWILDGSIVYQQIDPNSAYVTVTLSSLVESTTNNQLRMRMLDGSGFLEVSPVWTIPVDSTPPQTTHSFDPPLPPSGWFNTSVLISLQASDAVSGVAETLWRREGEIMWHSGNSITTLVSGTYHYRSRDHAGNLEDIHDLLVQIDMVPPQTTATLSPPRPASGWYSSSVTVTLVSTDTDSGVAETLWRRAGEETWQSGAAIVLDESSAIQFRSIDVAGNQEAIQEVSVSIDGQPPITTPSFSPPMPANGWFTSPVNVTLIPEDSQSGVERTWWRRVGEDWQQGSFFTTPSYGSYEYYSIDRAGNVEPVRELLVQVDMTPPTSTLTLPSVPASGWYTAPVTATILASDDLSGWAGESYYRLGAQAWEAGTSLVIASDGVHTLQYYSRDVAGNTETPRDAPLVRIDSIPPSVTHTVHNPADWAKPPVTITLSATDPHSGVQAIEYREQGAAGWTVVSNTVATLFVDGLQGDRPYTYEYRARDIAGNLAVSQTVTVQVDSTPPTQPTNLAATPSQWVNTNGGFALSWDNPADPSGIAGAYYQVGIDPVIGGAPSGPIYGADIESLTNLSVPTEGSHDVYVWLIDGAGNSTRFARAALHSAFKYDHTPPYVGDIVVSGPRGEDPLYYTGPVTITATCRDDVAGLANLRYQIDSDPVVTLAIGGAPTMTQRSLALFQEGSRKTVNLWTTDVAGNVQPVSETLTLRFDSLAPASPIAVTLSPAGWSRTNVFTVTWTNPFDYSGITAAYYKRSAAPTSPTDGLIEHLTPGSSQISGIVAPNEGQSALYVWLKDRAGNVDHRTAIMVPLRYDATPPSTTLNALGTMGGNDYYVTAVTLRFQANDSASGVAQTWYRINGGTPQLWDGRDVALDQEGVYTISYYSVDAAGNTEATRQSTIKIDLHKPICTLKVSQDYTTASLIRVDWVGKDTTNGSGITNYTVEYRRGGCNMWQTWYASTANTNGTLGGLLPNHFYYFRARVEDKAGHISEWTYDTANTYVYVEGLVNGGFDTCSYSGWVPASDTAGRLTTRVVTAPKRGGSTSCMARLSKDDWPATTYGVPVDAYASFYQAIQLPATDCDHGLVLSFWYRILSYDVAWSSEQQTWFDTFDVHVRDRDGNQLAMVLRDGYFPTGSGPKTGVLHDLGWKHFTVDLTPWAGQQIRILFEVWNRNDGYYPTWAYVDDVKLLPSPGRIIDIPLIAKGNRPGGANADGFSGWLGREIALEPRFYDPSKPIKR